MKMTKNKILAALLAGSLMAVAGNSMADSQYGYSASAAGVSAQAQVKVTVKVPELVVLRVGSSNAVDDLTLTAAATVNGAPGLISADGNNQVADWDGAVPTIASDEKSVTVYVWTNAKNVELDCESDDGLLDLNLEPEDILVDSPSTHPGANTACGTPVAIPQSALATSEWIYSVDPAALATAYAGTATQTTTYTATNI